MKKITFLSACAAFLLLGSEVVCGQSGVLLTPTTVNNDFGAGESSKISPGINITTPHNVLAPSENSSWPTVNPTPSIIYTGGVTYNLGWGSFSNALTNPSSINDIQIGDNTNTLGNTVIRAYTGDGYALGWISIVNKIPVPGNQTRASVWPDTYPLTELLNGTLNTNTAPVAFVKTAGEPLIEFSFNKFNYTGYTAATWGSLAPCGLALFTCVQCIEDGTGGYNISVKHHASNGLWAASAPADIPEAVYASTIDGSYQKTWPAGYYNATTSTTGTTRSYPIDDNVNLVQFTGTAMTNTDGIKNQVSLESKADNSGTLINYKRPTTVILQNGNHIFNSFEFEDVFWSFEQNEASIDVTTEHPNAIKRIGHLGDCNSGKSVAYSINPYWTGNIVDGKTKVDGAIQLQPNAIVCVQNDVVDATATSASFTDGAALPNAETDAIIVLPNDGRYTLRVKGNIDNINMAHDATTEDKYYSQATFPQNATDIYSYGSNPSIAAQFGTGFGFAGNSLTGYNLNSSVNIPAAPASTEASVLGVYGNYNYKTNNAEWHTNTPSFTSDNSGVIEIGPYTRGTDHMHIYSGGMLKNYEGCTDVCNFTMNIGNPTYLNGGTGDDMAPEFVINGTQPLYIMNYGNNGTGSCDPCAAGITFYSAGVGNLETAISGASTDGALQIQALGAVEFDTIFAPTVSQNNEIRVFSDGGSIKFDTSFVYTNSGDSNLLVWAKGTGGTRSCFDNACGGYVWLGGETSITQDSKGLTLLRSEKDDVVIDSSFIYTNTAQDDANGEFIMQAGEDIYGKTMVPGDAQNLIEFTPFGNKNILLEAQNTIHLEQKLSYQKTSPTATSTGDLILKAGYHNFNESADADVWTAGNCRNGSDITYSYPDRDECMAATGNGGDIWFEGPVDLQFTAFASDDNSSMLFRAYNSVFIDSTFTYNNETMVGGNTRVMAHTGNVEAIKYVGTQGSPADNAISYTVTQSDNATEIRIQAGNDATNADVMDPVDTCEISSCTVNKWNGNVLFNKPLTIDQSGKGRTVISSERDIESQVDAPFQFMYKNTALEAPFLMTAGRHIEAHRGIYFDYTDATETTTSDITMQAGRINRDAGAGATGCNSHLCKAAEGGSNLSTGYNASSTNTAYESYGKNTNDFSEGGSGHGSILLFDTVKFDYMGTGTILLTALNGNIESDPYLHRFDNTANRFYDNQGTAGYDGMNDYHKAPIILNHNGEGITRLEAIDIKLHDKLYYMGETRNNKNGQLYMAAYDSILTRNLYYTNQTDSGSVFITTDKYKATDTNCGEYNCETGAGGINQGHIVLGYGADATNQNYSDSIIFDFNSTATNTNTEGANLYIQAGYLGYTANTITKGYGGNITFDFMKINMATGNGTAGGYAEISTPNGNIWGKDSLQYHGINGDLLVDAGTGSVDDARAILWSGANCGTLDILNTQVPTNCDKDSSWRTGDIMLKGGSLNFNDVTGSGAGTGNATFRTRQGFIDTYDAFTVDSMRGDLLKYAGTENASVANEWGDVSERDFEYHPIENSGSVFFGADDNIMLNYGYSNGNESAYKYSTTNPGMYDVTDANANLIGTPNLLSTQEGDNPYYYTEYEHYIDGLTYAKYNVNKNGYLWYKQSVWPRKYHRLYRGCKAPIASQTSTCSSLTGKCETIDNGARPLMFNFDQDANSATIQSGGIGVVAANYIDMFTAFTYYGGQGAGLDAVPGMTTLRDEAVQGYGLYIKSQFNGSYPEKRRVTCFGCDTEESVCGADNTSAEMTYVAFHDDARIHAQDMKSYIEAPVVEFFGHAELDTWTPATGKSAPGSGTLTMKADSLIFHDSLIFDYKNIGISPFTTDASTRASDMRYGVVNDTKLNKFYLAKFGPAIEMNDRTTPILELGYQRCYEPGNDANAAPNINSEAGKESTPYVGGDVIVSLQHGYTFPIFNTVVANHARISFVDDMLDDIGNGGEYTESYVRTDLLRIRNKVEFYNGKGENGLIANDPEYRKGTFKMTSPVAMDEVEESGIYPTHLHMEPGSELSLPGEDSLIVEGETTIGGYGNIHDNISVKADGTIAPGYASLMESDCQSGCKQGELTIHNLHMEKDAIMRISVGRNNPCYDEDGKQISNTGCTAVDVLHVEDSIVFFGKIPLHVLLEGDDDKDAILDPGCYLFMTYNDTVGASKEYVKNLVLTVDRYQDSYFGLDFSESGKVYLCVMEFPQPIVQRYVDLPLVDGVITNPSAGKHYVAGHQNFSFTAAYTGTPLKVMATGYYSTNTVDLDKTAVLQADGTYLYTLYQITEPWTVTFGPETSSVTGNSEIEGQNVWAYNNTLHINVDKADIVSIYTLTGVLYKRMNIPEGFSKFTLDKGMYIVTLKDGSVYKIVIK